MYGLLLFAIKRAVIVLAAISPIAIPSVKVDE